MSEAEEKLLSIKDANGIDALVGLYEMITNRFTFSLKVDGKKKSLTRDELAGYFFNASPDVRRAAYRELYRVYIENSTILAQIYSHRARDWHAEGVELREKLRRYDIYTPLAKAEKKYDYAQAGKMVLDTFQEFSPQVGDLARRVFDEQHLDAQTRHGKRGGAFCYSALPELTPWVLVNYSGRPGDIATLAHEMGHAVHAMLAGKHSVLSFHASLPLAETASVFAEMQLTDRLLREEQDPAVRRDLLVRAIDDAYITVIRQAYFTLFERDAHRMLVEGKSFDELADHYLSNLAEQFGDAVELADEFKWEWITVPHLYNEPFYTYAYSFGQLLVLALYQQYRREGAAFVPRYLKILSYGGAEAPTKILQEAGLDITSAAFWQAGFDVLEEMITELTQIA